jgi:hypothetical protein
VPRDQWPAKADSHEDPHDHEDGEDAGKRGHPPNPTRVPTPHRLLAEAGGREPTERVRLSLRSRLLVRLVVEHLRSDGEPAPGGKDHRGFGGVRTRRRSCGVARLSGIGVDDWVPRRASRNPSYASP